MSSVESVHAAGASLARSKSTLATSSWCRLIRPAEPVEHGHRAAPNNATERQPKPGARPLRSDFDRFEVVLAKYLAAGSVRGGVVDDGHGIACNAVVEPDSAHADVGLERGVVTGSTSASTARRAVAIVGQPALRSAGLHTRTEQSPRRSTRGRCSGCTAGIAVLSAFEQGKHDIEDSRRLIDTWCRHEARRARAGVKAGGIIGAALGPLPRGHVGVDAVVMSTCMTRSRRAAGRRRSC